MVCPECKQEKGCGCTFLETTKREYKVCEDCKNKLDKNESKNTKPNVQGV